MAAGCNRTTQKLHIWNKKVKTAHIVWVSAYIRSVWTACFSPAVTETHPNTSGLEPQVQTWTSEPPRSCSEAQIIHENSKQEVTFHPPAVIWNMNVLPSLLVTPHSSSARRRLRGQRSAVTRRTGGKVLLLSEWDVLQPTQWNLTGRWRRAAKEEPKCFTLTASELSWGSTKKLKEEEMCLEATNKQLK